MKRIFILAIMLAMVLGFSIQAHAILVLSGDGNITTDLSSGNYDNYQFFTNVLQGGSQVAVINAAGSFDNNIDNYYNSLSGVTSSIISQITAESLTGLDLFVAAKPGLAFSESELSVLSSFYTGGGSIFFLGENASSDDAANLYINNALTYLDSSMRIVYGSTFDSGYHVASGGQIVSDPLTSGVSEFEYAAPNQVIITGGTYLFYGSDDQPFISYEGGPSAPVVPEPISSTLFIVGGATLGFRRFRKGVRK